MEEEHVHPGHELAIAWEFMAKQLRRLPIPIEICDAAGVIPDEPRDIALSLDKARLALLDEPIGVQLKAFLRQSTLEWQLIFDLAFKVDSGLIEHGGQLPTEDQWQMQAYVYIRTALFGKLSLCDHMIEDGDTTE